MVNTIIMTSLNPFPTWMHSKMSSTGRPVDEISVISLFTVIDGGHFGFYALENFARLFKRGIGAYFFYKFLKVPKTTVKPYLQKVGHGMRVLDPTSKATSHYLSWWIGPLEARLFYPPPSNSRCLDFAVSWTSMMRINQGREWSSRIWS